VLVWCPISKDFKDFFCISRSLPISPHKKKKRQQAAGESEKLYERQLKGFSLFSSTLSSNAL